jgi:hypothetical protein
MVTTKAVKPKAQEDRNRYVPIIVPAASSESRSVLGRVSLAELSKVANIKRTLRIPTTVCVIKMDRWRSRRSKDLSKKIPGVRKRAVVTSPPKKPYTRDAFSCFAKLGAIIIEVLIMRTMLRVSIVFL